MKKRTLKKRPPNVASATLAVTPGSAWKRINRRRLPRTGFIVAGSWRKGLDGEVAWSMSSISDGNGFPRWADDDRTHYLRLPSPPNGRHEPDGGKAATKPLN